jgi:hypothetical protein
MYLSGIFAIYYVIAPTPDPSPKAGRGDVTEIRYIQWRMPLHIPNFGFFSPFLGEGGKGDGVKKGGTS